MSSAGHVFDMINRAKYNASLKQGRRDRIQRIKDAFNDEIHAHKGLKTEYRELSKSDLEIIRKNIREKLRRQRKNMIIKSTIVTLIVSIVLIIIIFYLPKDSLINR